MLGVLHGNPSADHDQHGGVDIRPAQLSEQNDLDHCAKRRAEEDGKGSPRKKFSSHGMHGRVHHVGAESVEFAVGKVDDAHDAEDQRQADPQQGIGAAEDQRVEAVLEKLIHGMAPLSRTIADMWSRGWDLATNISQRGQGTLPAPPNPASDSLRLEA